MEEIIQEFKEIIWHWIDRQVERDKLNKKQS